MEGKTMKKRNKKRLQSLLRGLGQLGKAAAMGATAAKQTPASAPDNPPAGNLAGTKEGCGGCGSKK